MKNRFSILIVLIVALMLLSSLNASAWYIHVKVTYGKWNETTKKCDSGSDLCSIEITWGTAFSADLSSNQVELAGDGTIRNGRLYITLSEPIPPDMMQGKSRLKYTIHEDTPLTLDPGLAAEVGYDRILLKKGTYSFGGKNHKLSSIKNNPLY